jgi:hypothetical protein
LLSQSSFKKPFSFINTRLCAAKLGQGKLRISRGITSFELPKYRGMSNVFYKLLIL